MDSYGKLMMIRNSLFRKRQLPRSAPGFVESAGARSRLRQPRFPAQRALSPLAVSRSADQDCPPALPWAATAQGTMRGVVKPNLALSCLRLLSRILLLCFSMFGAAWVALSENTSARLSTARCVQPAEPAAEIYKGGRGSIHCKAKRCFQPTFMKN